MGGCRCRGFWEAWIGRGWVGLVLLVLAATPLRAGTYPVVGPEQFIRPRGEPLVRHRFFHGLRLGIPYLLVIENGAAGSLDPVASAEVLLNGEVVAGPNLFRSRVERFEVPIDPIFERGEINRLVIRLAGKPGSGLTLAVVGVDEKAPEIELLRPQDSRLTTTNTPELLVAWRDEAAQVDPDTASILLDGSDLTSGCVIAFTDARCQVDPLADGTHLLTVEVADRAGNLGEASFAFEVDLDREPPRVTFTSPADGALVRSPTVPVEGLVTDNEEIARVTLSGGEVSLDGERFTGRASLTRGGQTLSVVAQDAAGNRGSAEVEVVLDLRAPELTVDPVPSTVHAEEVDITGRVLFAEDLASLTVAGSEVELSEAGFFAAQVPVVPGLNVLPVRVEDRAGNVGEKLVEVTRVELPRVRITEPADLSLVVGGTVDVRGTVNLAGADASEIAVTVNGQPAELSGDPSSGGATFEARGVPVEGERQVLEALAVTASGAVGSDRVHVLRDVAAPRLVVDFPASGAKVATERVTVTGRIHDLEPSAGGLRVDVEGLSAVVVDGRFQVEDVPLAPGDNDLRVRAIDGAGHPEEVAVPVISEPPPPGGPRFGSVLGDTQGGPIDSELPEPLSVQVLDFAGQPLVGAPVLFRIAAGDGSLARVGETEALRQVAVGTDSEGLARARLRLGDNAGAGAHRVEVSSPGIAVPLVMTASALPGPPALLLLDGGGFQTGTAGAQVPEPLSVVVTDAGWNRLAGVPVRFSVVKGEGRLGNGEVQQTVSTDAQGRAAVRLTLDPREGVANNLVEATLGERQRGFVTFVASGRAAGDPAETSLSGRVLDNTDLPIAGVTVALEGTSLTARTDEQGRFRLTGVPVGTSHLRVDGGTAERPGVWPVLDFEVVPVPGRDNPLPRPVYLLPLNVERGLAVSETQGGTVTLSEVPGLALEVAPGSVTFPDGSKSGVVSVTVVHGDKVPRTPSFGAQPRLVLTIQPAGAVFDPPARLTLPNTAGLAPGREIELVSFDHDVGRFVVFGPGVVSEDGLTLSSVPGLGLLEAGWSFEATPAPAGTAHQCSPSCEIPDGSQCIPGCPTSPTSVDAVLPSAKISADTDSEARLRNVADTGLECEGCDEKDIGMCETNPTCELGLCVGEPVTVSEIEGPCVAARGEVVIFRVTSNAPEKIQWTAEMADPGEGNGGSLQTVFSVVDQEVTVRAGCERTVEKEVLIRRPCSEIEAELRTPDAPAAQPSQPVFGDTQVIYRPREKLKLAKCSEDEKKCVTVETLEIPIAIFLASEEDLGRKDISGPFDPDVTPETCAAIIADLAPPSSTEGPPRRNYWSKDIVEEHEKFHRMDIKERVLQPSLDNLAQNLRNSCAGCSGQEQEPSLEEVLEKLGAFIRESFGEYLIGHEQRAYEATNSLYSRLIGGIKERARQGGEDWPDECK